MSLLALFWYLLESVCSTDISLLVDHEQGDLQVQSQWTGHAEFRAVNHNLGHSVPGLGIHCMDYIPIRGPTLRRCGGGALKQWYNDQPWLWWQQARCCQWCSAGTCIQQHQQDQSVCHIPLSSVALDELSLLWRRTGELTLLHYQSPVNHDSTTKWRSKQLHKQNPWLQPGYHAW